MTKLLSALLSIFALTSCSGHLTRSNAKKQLEQLVKQQGQPQGGHDLSSVYRIMIHSNRILQVPFYLQPDTSPSGLSRSMSGAWNLQKAGQKVLREISTLMSNAAIAINGKLRFRYPN